MKKLINKIKEFFKAEPEPQTCVIKRNNFGSWSIYLSIDPEIRIGRFASAEDARRVAVLYNFLKVEEICE